MRGVVGRDGGGDARLLHPLANALGHGLAHRLNGGLGARASAARLRVSTDHRALVVGLLARVAGHEEHARARRTRHEPGARGPAPSNDDAEEARRQRLLANPARRALIKAFAALVVADLTRYPVR